MLAASRRDTERPRAERGSLAPLKASVKRQRAAYDRLEQRNLELDRFLLEATERRRRRGL